jgi:uncharacterized OsmC-like protein/alpha/beta superfamily hydrolase
MTTSSLSEKIVFTGADGSSRLAARLDSPAGTPVAYALFAHCFTCTMNVFAAARIAEGLTRHGIAVLRFDFTGLGASEGEFANTDFSSNVGDLIAAADWLRRDRSAPRLLIGHSLGGAAVLAAAQSVPEATAVATIAAPADPAHVRNHIQGDVDAIERDGEAEVCLAGRPFRIRREFLRDIEGQKLDAAIVGLKRALIIFHAPLDETVGIDQATKIFVAAKHPKSFVSLDDADHLLSRREDAAYVADVIAAWAKRYVVEAAAADAPADAKAPDNAVTVTETGNGKFQQRISYGGVHEGLADEPESYGGGNTGPAPYDLLLAGLGACTTMTVRMYAERKNLPLDRVSVTLRHGKIHAKDCETCETAEGRVDRIERRIRLDGDLTDDQRSKLMEIADKCPVHRTLHSEVLIETALEK